MHRTRLSILAATAALTLAGCAACTNEDGTPMSAASEEPSSTTSTTVAAAPHGEDGSTDMDDHGEVGEPIQGEDGRWRTHLGHDGMIEISEYPPDAEPTPEQQAAADAFVAEVMLLAPHYQDIANARADGYVRQDPFGDDHLANLDRLGDDVHLDTSAPEFVMYDPETDEFLGFMFVVPPGEHGPQIGGPLTVWHYHEYPPTCWEGSIPRPEWYDESSGTCTQGILASTTPQMLHVWVVPNADGVFASHMTPPDA